MGNFFIFIFSHRFPSSRILSVAVTAVITTLLGIVSTRAVFVPGPDQFTFRRGL
jgi:hypothetical protein